MTTGTRDLRGVRLGLHAITIALTIVTTVRAADDHAPVFLAVGGGVTFLAVYAAAALPVVRASTRAATVWVFALTLVWFALLAVSSEFVWLLFPLILVGGHFLPFVPSILYTLCVIAASIAAPALHGAAITVAGVIGPLIGGLFGLGIARGYTRLLRDAAERRRLIASLVSAQDEMASLQDELARSQRESGAIAERTRLSRDVHDTIAQDLSSIALLARGAALSPDQDRTLEQIEELARSGLEDARRIVNALAPAELEDGALVDAVRRMADRLHEETGADVTVTADPTLPALGSAVDVALLRTLQSALANVRRHSGAHRVTVTVSDMGDSVRCDVADDGSGFDAAAWESTVSTASYGLRAMRERLRELGGGLDVESEPGQGTVLSAYVPIGAPS